MSTAIQAIQLRAVPIGGDGFRVPAPAVAPDTATAASSHTDAAQAALRFDLERALDELAERAAESGAALNFRVDESSGRVVVQVIDRRDGTVLRQMPSEEALRIARNLARYESYLIEVRA